ncbi:adenylate cyclase [Prunus dulcis]|uniref:Adenylate cyclase n=1 Tax=Prunus dulcis TaxID=3755 RepID=A0A4Y1R4P8_PRUDU|nr:triphosphate tunnel metalloenzyme 3-like [Prunus dulcis]BBG99150.1 adenylate cyclase [Prunus dulcis]VVA19874.1 PREDICTED: triphosphate tunel metalloenzyme 3 [Prunus dulcis]
MEVEVKLRLSDASAHQKLTDLLSPFHVQTLIQENIFFDGSSAELSSNRAILRLRFYDGVSPCVLSLKAKPVISDGVSRVQELEEPFDPVLGRACVAEPWRLSVVDSSALLKRVREEYGVREEGLGFVCLGGFRNVRGLYEWKGLKIEVDESNYDFGTCYEVECESSNPERDKKILEKLLEENGIRFQYSEVSKFAIFRSGKLPE